nr:hypothetical protein PanWU01x14_023570 [Ipomoea batatas]
MHRRVRRIHEHSGFIRGIKRLKPLLLQYPPYAIKYPLVRTAAELQSLLHHIHGREDGVAGHRGADPRRGMGGGVIRISSGKRLLTELINGENRLNGMTNANGLDWAKPYGLHLGLDSIDGEHCHVLHHAGDGSGDHELPEAEPVMSSGYFLLSVIIRRLRHR